MLGQPPVWTIILNRVAEERDIMKNRAIEEELRLGLALGERNPENSVIHEHEELMGPGESFHHSQVMIDNAIERSMNASFRESRPSHAEAQGLSLSILNDETEQLQERVDLPLRQTMHVKSKNSTRLTMPDAPQPPSKRKAKANMFVIPDEQAETPISSEDDEAFFRDNMAIRRAQIENEQREQS